MKKRLPKVFLCILLVLLIGSNIYFISKDMEPNIYVQIGLPHFNEESDVSAIEFTPILNQEDTNTILLAFMLARPMDSAQFPTDLPHGYLNVIYDACSYPHKMWLTEDSVIFETSTNDVVSFRQYHNDHNNVVPLLKEILETLKNPNFS